MAYALPLATAEVATAVFGLVWWSERDNLRRRMRHGRGQLRVGWIAEAAMARCSGPRRPNSSRKQT